MTIVITPSEILEDKDRVGVSESIQNLNSENVMSKSIAANNTHILPDDTLVVVLLDSTMKNDSAELVNAVKSEKMQDKKKNTKKRYLLAALKLKPVM